MNKLSLKFNLADFMDTIDVRDGLNPALRALFFDLETTRQDDKFKNSSRLLKDVIGINENDFEDIYDLLVNTTDPRVDLPLVSGLGNYGFPPAYPDFSEMKLSGFARIIIGRGNPDDLNLPFTMPVPYALVCGILGFGTSETKMPTHNLAEVIDAMIALIKNPELETKDLLEYIKGPDLLIGGTIENPEELCSIYESGAGTIRIVVTPQNFNWNWFESVGNYCDWYELKFRKIRGKEAYRIQVPYYAFMCDGKNREIMSLKSIIKKHLEYYRAYKSELNDDELCGALTSLKKDSTNRKTVW